MREMVHEAIAGAREFLGEVVGDLRGEARLSDDELLARYEQQHRGQPWKMLEFAGQQAQGGDVLGEALRYEAQMEKMMASSVKPVRALAGGRQTSNQVGGG